MPYLNIAFATLFTASFLVFFTPVEKWLKKLFNWQASPVTLPILTVLGVTGLFIYAGGTTGFLHLIMAAVCVWALGFGFLSNRRYIYILAILCLTACPFLLIAKLDNLAEFLAVLCYLCMALGVLKDILYEKILIN